MLLTQTQLNKALLDLTVRFLGAAAPFHEAACYTHRDTQQVGSYYKVDLMANAGARSRAGTALRLNELATAPGGEPMATETTITSGTFATVNYRTRELIPYQVLKPGSGAELGPVATVTRRVLRRLVNDMDRAFALLFADDDLYAAANKSTLTTGAAGTSWAPASYASANTDPLGVIRAGADAVLKTIGHRPNVLLGTGDAIGALCDHPDVADLVKYTDAGVRFLSDATPVPEIRGMKIVRADSVINSAAPGATAVPAYALRDVDLGLSCVIMAYVPDPSTFDGTCSFLRILVPTPAQGGYGPTVRTYRDDDREGTWVDAEVSFDLRAPAVDGSSNIVGAYLVQSVII